MKIKTTETFNIKIATPKQNIKFSKIDTRNAMKIAMKIRKKASIKLKCAFNSVSLSLCLKKAYKKVLKMKLKVCGIFTRKNISKINLQIKKQFGYENIRKFVLNEDVINLKPNNFMQSIVLNVAQLEFEYQRR